MQAAVPLASISCLVRSRPPPSLMAGTEKDLWKRPLGRGRGGGWTLELGGWETAPCPLARLCFCLLLGEMSLDGCKVSS
jgi:hypothetical protein